CAILCTVCLSRLCLPSSFRRHQNPAVFPYTTLFRSLGIEDRIPERAQAIRVMMMELNRISSHLVAMGTFGMELGASRPGARRSGDRKSTRLNSSHVKISYAVFCLKKKKKIGSASLGR